MKIVFQNVPKWEGIPHAEAELATRFKWAAEVLGLEALVSSNARVIEEFGPDIVIPLHFFLPKLFDAFTVGCMWNPVPYFTDRSQTWDYVKSYDGYGVASHVQEQLVRQIKLKSPSPYLLLQLYPSANTTEFEKPATLGTPVYIGTNWTNTRHQDLFVKSGNVHVYGRKDRWTHLPPEVFKGELPFGGQHVLARYRSSGVGLALHHQAHIDEAIPSMRPFEIAASGAVMIADQNPFVREAFGDSVLYIDTGRETEELIGALRNHCAWIASHPAQAIEMARSCNDIFNKRYALEVLLGNLIDSVGEFKTESLLNRTDDLPSVEVIVPWNSEEPEGFLRTLKSLLAQTYGSVNFILVIQGTQNDSAEVLQMISQNMIVPAGSVRTKTISEKQSWLFEGIRESRATYIGFAGNGTSFYSNHLEDLVGILEHNEEAVGSYSGSVGQAQVASGETLQLCCFSDLSEMTEPAEQLQCSSMLMKRKKLPWQVLHQKLPDLQDHDEVIFKSLLIDNGLNVIFSEKVSCRIDQKVRGDFPTIRDDDLMNVILEKSKVLGNRLADNIQQSENTQGKRGIRERIAGILPKR
jgi:hypothetical protein